MAGTEATEDEELRRALLLSLGADENNLELYDGRCVSLAARHVAADTVGMSPFSRGGALFCNRVAGLADPARGNSGTLSFEDIVRVSGTLYPQRALLSSFGEDVDWLGAQLGPRCCLTLVRHFNADSEPPGVHKLAERLTVVHPPGLGSRGCFHAKLMLLHFADRVRVAVSTANLTEPDWTWISQLIWVADFPRRIAGDSSSADSPFVSDLREFLDGLVDDTEVWLRDLGDFGDHHTAARLVFSKPGSFNGSQACRVGLPLLHHRLKQAYPEFANSRRCTRLFAATSSLGMLSHDWLARFPCCGPPCRATINVLFPTQRDIHRAIAAGFTGEEVVCATTAVVAIVSISSHNR